MLRMNILVLGQVISAVVQQANAQTEPDMIQLPAACVEVGTLLMGEHANPLREVCLDSFSIGRYEVTFREYDLFTSATGRATRHDAGFGREERPVIDVDWFDALAYADWLSEVTGKRYRLPTDAEWEYAAKGNAEFGFRYSWGAEPEENKANCRSCGGQWGGEMTSPVGSFEANTFGLHDIHGNVWEWTADCYVRNDAREVGDNQCAGVVRGGSWDVHADHLVFWLRAPQLRKRPARDIGFRLVLEH